MKLYYHPVSTTSRPVVLFATESGIDLDYQLVDLFTGENGCNPFRPPAPLRRIVDHRKRLQGDRFGGAIGQRTAEIVPIALHGKGSCPDRPAEVEGKDLGAGIPPELQRH